MLFRPRVTAIGLCPDDAERARRALASAKIEFRQVGRHEATPLSNAEGVILYDVNATYPWRSAVREARAARAGICMILVAPAPDNVLCIEALEAGAYDVLPKPLEEIELRFIVRGAVLRLSQAAVHRPPAAD